MVIEKESHFKEIDGIKLPLTVMPECFYSAVNYKPSKGDVIIASFPKCGTTWLIQIVLLIFRKGIPLTTAQEYFSSNIYLEMAGAKALKRMAKPGCIKTHIPFERLNFSSDPDVKYFYIARHPADCAVSYYYHTQFFPTYFASNKTFEDFFQYFLEGNMIYNDYFDHLLSWYHHRREPNVFFLTFEELRSDTRSFVLKIARFLGNEYYDSLISDNGQILNDVLHYSSLDHMKSTVNLFYEKTFTTALPFDEQEDTPQLVYYKRILHDALKKGHFSKGSFVRNGVVGEGKISLTDKQKDILMAHIREKTAHSDVMNLWKK